MTLDQIPLFAMLKGKLGYLNERQRLISENVANADTPGYAPYDLKPFKVEAGIPGPASPGIAGVRTSAAHIAIKTEQKPAWQAQVRPDSEARLDGNQVVLEDQMIKMGEARMSYDAAIGLYQKSLNLLRLAARRPGGA
jgi:flagellar basal-body rod protein FlgB